MGWKIHEAANDFRLSLGGGWHGHAFNGECWHLRRSCLRCRIDWRRRTLQIWCVPNCRARWGIFP
jgi:hypothetical protein